MLVHGVVLALVPWLLDSSDLIYGRRSRPLPGQDRRGEPVRPVMRRPMPPASSAAGRRPAARATAKPAPEQEPAADAKPAPDRKRAASGAGTR
jgi:hypothetical protein